MARKAVAASHCGICGRSEREAALLSVEWVRPNIARYLDDAHPKWRESRFICSTDLQMARWQALESAIERERGELTELDRSVIASMSRDETLSQNVEEDYAEQLSFGERAADRIAGFAGSWAFILTFIGVLMLWVTVNLVPLLRQPFDPYPFILLNLMLSMIAAFQAPLIMMSQKRQEAKDRLRSLNDYRVNLKAELEIRHLHEKFDHHLMRQWERLTEIQETQMELLSQPLPTSARSAAKKKKASKAAGDSPQRSALPPSDPKPS